MLAPNDRPKTKSGPVESLGNGGDEIHGAPMAPRFDGLMLLASPCGATEFVWRHVAGKPIRGHGVWLASSPL